MAEAPNGSPIEFRHDSMLRIEHPNDPQPNVSHTSPPNKPTTNNTTPAKLNVTPRGQPSGFEVLRSGKASGIDFAVLRVTKPIILTGCAWLSVLLHRIRIFGLTVHRGQAPILAVSAPLAPLLLKLSPCPPSTGEKIYSGRTETDLSLKREPAPAALIHDRVKRSLRSDFEAPNSNAAIVLVSSCPQDEQLWKAADGFPESDDLSFTLSETLQHLSLPNFDAFAPVLPSLRISRSAEYIAAFEEWANWESFLHEIDAFLAERPASELRVLVSGTGGSGKSTFVRCLSNHLATVCNGLVFIDTDVGQPELNLPGLVAAHHVSELHLGSAIAHIRGVPVAGRLLGETTPRDDPELYEGCIRVVSKSGLARAAHHGVPVLVNTDGWVSGAGSDFLNAVVTQTRPTHAVCMVVGRSQTSAPRPSFQTDDSEMRIFYMQRPLAESRPFYTRSVARELQIAAYFCKELGLGRVRAVAIDLLPVFLRGEQIDSVERALLLMNASIVAIATSTLPSRLRMAEANVVGFGLVRGVSLEKKMAYVSTPVLPTVLRQSVALIVCEHIHVPNAMMLAAMCGSQESATSPFLLRNHIDGSHHMHSRSSLQRRTTNLPG